MAGLAAAFCFDACLAASNSSICLTIASNLAVTLFDSTRKTAWASLALTALYSPFSSKANGLPSSPKTSAARSVPSSCIFSDKTKPSSCASSICLTSSSLFSRYSRTLNGFVWVGLFCSSSSSACRLCFSSSVSSAAGAGVSCPCASAWTASGVLMPTWSPSVTVGVSCFVSLPNSSSAISEAFLGLNPPFINSSMRFCFGSSNAARC